MSTETPESLKVSSAQDIRKNSAEKNKGTLLKLPSGFVVKLMEPDLIEMIRNGQMPADLIEVALNNKQGLDKTNVKNIPLFFEFMKRMILITVVEPVVVDSDECKENEISYKDLSDNDKMAIFNGWRYEGKSLETFRKKEQTNDEKSGPDLPKVSGDETK